MVRALFSFCKWATVTLGLFSSFLEMIPFVDRKKISFPKELKIIKEVTNDDNYKNASLAEFSEIS